MNEEKKTNASVPPRAPRPAAKSTIVKRNLNPIAEMQEKTKQQVRPAAPAQRQQSVQAKSAASATPKPQVIAQKSEAAKVAPVKASSQVQRKSQPSNTVKTSVATPIKTENKQPARSAAQKAVKTEALQVNSVSNHNVQSRNVQFKSEQLPKPAQSRPTAYVNAGRASAPRPINRPEPERITSPEMQRKRETVNSYKYDNRKGSKKVSPIKIVAYALSFVLTFAIILLATVFVSLKMICGETSPAAKELLVTTLLETGQMKDVASWFLSAEEIQQIVDDNTMSSFENDIDSSLISIDKTPDTNEGSEEQKDIEVVEISGRTFFGTLLIIKDPSRVELSSIYPWKNEGVPLDELVKDAGAVAGINGGLYNSSNNSGGRPYGVVVCKGELQLNEPNQFPGLVLIGFTEDDILEIIPIDGYSKQDIIDLVAEKKIRDAVSFQEEASDKNNHFVQLVINGEARDMNGMGSGLNPRTAIGQRADGSVLMLVTDGRGKAGHLGACASDLINIMVEYGAVNAANLDGGSSSCMYYNDEYLMTSVTFYHSNSSWKLPLAFVIK